MKSETELVHHNFPLAHSKIYQTIIAPGKQYLAEHLHAELEIILVLSGSIIVSVGGKEIVLYKGDSLYLGSKVIHAIKPSTVFSKIIIIQAQANMFSAAPSMDRSDNYLYTFLAHRYAKPFYLFSEHGNLFSDTIYKIQNEIIGDLPHKNWFVKSYIDLLFAILLRENIITDQIPEERNKKITNLLPTISYIEKNYRNPISLESLCKCSNYNKYYLCKLFKEILGVSVTEYINFVRCFHAEKQLVESEQKILALAYANGFSSVQYFNRVFKEHFGYTPTQYKKMVKESAKS